MNSKGYLITPRKRLTSPLTLIIYLSVDILTNPISISLFVVVFS